MLTECQENEGFLKAVNAKGKSLIFQQQKMISHLIAKLSEYKKLQR